MKTYPSRYQIADQHIHLSYDKVHVRVQVYVQVYMQIPFELLN